MLHSNEGPDVTAVFGASTPPRAISGMLRRLAFRYSESSYGHWLPLMAADRIGVVEGYVEDLSRGHIPNVFAERGWAAEWKYNRTSLLLRIGVGVALIAAAAAYVGSDDD